MKEIYILSREVNISITEVHMLPDFEREILFNLYLTDKKNRTEELDELKNL